MFQAIHGSAFDLAGKNQANPIASIWSVQMMLDHLGEKELATHLMHAIETVLREQRIRTRDLGGNNSTTQMTDAVCQALKTEMKIITEGHYGGCRHDESENSNQDRSLAAAAVGTSQASSGQRIELISIYGIRGLQRTEAPAMGT